jgi:hypothetical protein
MRKIVIVLITIAFVSSISCGIALAKAKTAAKSSTQAADISCIKTAVEKREKAIQAAMEEFNKSVKSDLKDREKALLAAWSITDVAKRRASIKSAWSTFNTSFKTDKKTFNDAVKAARTQFAADVKACKGTITTEEPETDISL